MRLLFRGLDYILDMGVNLSNYLGYVASARLLNEDELSNAVFFFWKIIKSQLRNLDW